MEKLPGSEFIHFVPRISDPTSCGFSDKRYGSGFSISTNHKMVDCPKCLDIIHAPLTPPVETPSPEMVERARKAIDEACLLGKDGRDTEINKDLLLQSFITGSKE